MRNVTCEFLMIRSVVQMYRIGYVAFLHMEWRLRSIFRESFRFRGWKFDSIQYRQRNVGRSKGIGTNLYVVCPFREDSLPWTRIEMEFFAE